MNCDLSDVTSQMDLVREAFHYKSRFEGSIMVFKIDFPVIEDPAFPFLMKDLALLAQTGFRVILVPGARESIDAALKVQNITSISLKPDNNSEQIRVTSAQAIPYVQMAAFDAATRLMTYLSGSRVDAVIGNFVRARGLGVVNGIDMEHSGAVDKIYTDSISRVLKLGMIPILPCIGWSPSGKPYNVPSDEIALNVSAALGASKLFIVSVHGSLPGGLFPDDGGAVRLTPQETETFIAANSGSGANSGQTLAVLRKLRLALKAVRAGVDRVHLINGDEEGSVLRELFSNLGTGAMIYTDVYEAIRPMHSRDLPDMLRLMEPLMQSGILIRRTAEQIQEKKEDYSVYEIDGSVHACGALHDWGEGQGEIAAVAADPLYSGMKLGRRIVGYLADKARKNGLGRVFVLTTHTQDWFESLGFSEASVDSLPQRKRELYNNERKSKVFALNLNGGSRH